MAVFGCCFIDFCVNFTFECLFVFIFLTFAHIHVACSTMEIDNDISSNQSDMDVSFGENHNIGKLFWLVYSTYF